jgi:tetratricopeptide (TPR) repeat protein
MTAVGLAGDSQATGSADAAPPERSALNPPVLAVSLLLMAFVAYVPAMRGGFIWDDDNYVTKNTNLRSVQGLRDIWLSPRTSPQYYPLVFTTFWLEYHCWELAPFGYHFINVAVHGLAAVLLWRVLRTLSVPGAWFAAAIFALHPVQVESVAWITERKNTLSAALYLAAMLCYFRFDPPEVKTGTRRRGWYAAALGLFVAALLSKTVACSLPATLLLVYWWKRGRVSRLELTPLAPFFVAGASLAFFTVWTEKIHVGAQGSEWTLTPIERCLVAGRAVWFYAGKLLWPAKLIFIYPRWEIDGRVAWQYAFPLLLLGVIAALWLLRGRIGRGPLTAVLLFVGTLVPALGFFDVYPMRYSYVADHFQYLATPALIALAAALATQASSRLGQARALGWPLLCGTVLTVLGLLTWHQGEAYQSRRTLWEDVLAKDADCWMAHYNLGYELHKDRNLDGAIAQYRIGLAHKPEERGYLNLGSALLDQGKVDEAIEAFRAEIASHPSLAVAHQQLGVALLRVGKLSDAENALREALKKDDGDPESYHDLGMVLFEQGRAEEAIAAWRQALQLQPQSVRYRAGLDQARAWTLATAPQADARGAAQALELAESACRATGYMEPDFVATLAAAYAANGRFAEAVTAARRAAILAAEAGRKPLAERIEGRIKRYEARQPERSTGMGTSGR